MTIISDNFFLLLCYTNINVKMMIVGVKSVIVCLPEEKKMYARMNEDVFM